MQRTLVLVKPDGVQRGLAGAIVARLERRGLKLVGLKMTDKVIPRRHAVVLQGGRAIGECTSGTFSPTLRIGIALAYVEPGSVGEADRVDVEVRQKRGAAVVSKPPFVDSDPRR